MDEHTHVREWEVILSLSKNIYAVCLNCDECMDKEDIAARLNEYAALKRAGQGMMEIAELAMPDTFFQSDSRVNAMRALLGES